MTALQQLLEQIEHLSPEEKVALRNHLNEQSASTGSESKTGLRAASSASRSSTALWGLFSHQADTLDRIVETVYESREHRPLRLP